jgi:DNA-binding transcriptional regulator YiaG
MSHTPRPQAHPNTAHSTVLADAVWQALDGQAGREEQQQQASELRTGVFPATLARQILQGLSTLTFPPARRADATPHEAQRDDAPPNAEASEHSLAALQAWIERLLQEKGVMEPILRFLQTSQMGKARESLEHARGTDPLAAIRPEPDQAALDAHAPDAASAMLLDTCAKMLTPVLVKVLEAHLDAVGGKAAAPKRKSLSLPLPLDEQLHVLSAAHYQAVREVLAQAAFDKAEGTPWPTACLEKGRARGHAQLRPVLTDQQPFLPPEEVERWTQLMWRQRGELSDLDADTLDALSAIWLYQAKDPNDDAVADVDDLLSMRGLTRHRGGQGRRGGYMAHQRTKMLQSLSHIQNLWLTMAELETYDGEDARPGRRRRKPTTRAIQSRAVVITDLMGQLRLDGFVDVEKFIFRPGKVFAYFLAGPGRQTALLSAKALQYDPYRQTWEKRLTRYLSWQWRCEARTGDYMQPFEVTTLLKAVGHPVNRRRLAWQRERLEHTLDTIQHDKVIAAWQYAQEHDDWPKSTILIEPPDRIREQYQHLEQHEAPHRRTLPAPATLGERLKRRRQALGLSQIQAAEQLGLHQGYFSRLERGHAAPSPAARQRLEHWCAGEA